MERTLQSLLTHSFTRYSQQHALPGRVYNAAWSLINCRTARLGGHTQYCPHGHVERVWYNSCKHRSCPQCNGLSTERWLEKQKTRLIDCPHYHIIFTLPHELNVLWQYNRASMEQLLFSAVSASLKTLCVDGPYLAGEPGFICALHSWGRSLTLHPHIHCLITDGGLTAQGQWQRPKKSCLLPGRVVSALFRGKMLAEIKQQHLTTPMRLPPTVTSQALSNLLNRLGRKKWHVYVQQRYAHGEGVLIYLSRYLRGGPLANLQIQAIDATTIRYRYYSHKNNATQALTLSHDAFLTRYFWHVPTKGRQLVRYYGLYANGKRSRLASAQCIDGGVKPSSKTTLTWQAYLKRLGIAAQRYQCPVCGSELHTRPITARQQGPPAVKARH